MLHTNSPSVIHPNLKLLSNSSTILLHKCPRKYELYKLLPQRGDSQDGDEHTDYGHVVGLGVQTLLATGELDKAIFAMYLSWSRYIDDDSGKEAKKTFWHAIYSIEKFAGLRKSVFGNYELAHFDGRPATELGFSIDLGGGWYYRGKLDALLINRRTNELVVYEGKTTRFKNVHEASYKHSGQSLGYSVLIDTLAASLGVEGNSSYAVKYCVYKTSAYEWEVFSFNKSHHHRALWIKDLLLDVEYVEQRAADEYFPMRGENCFDFFRPCEYFGMCELGNDSVLGGKPAVVKVDKEEEYTFRYSLEDIIRTQVAKQEAAIGEVG